MGQFRQYTQAVACGGLLILLLVAGCGSGPKRLAYEGPAWNPSSQAAKIIEMHDADGNGVLGPEELEKSPAMKAALRFGDRNRDGKLDQTEIMARLSFFRDSRTYRAKTVCLVTSSGKPLAGVAVRFVPEEAIAGVIGPAQGVTDASGRAAMAVEGAAQPGVPPGFYKVEILKKDTASGTISPRFTAETTLGCEVAPDGGPEGLMPKFDVKKG